MTHRTKLHDVIRSFGSSIFHVKWITKDGNIRNANARRHVLKGIKRTGKKINKNDNSLIPIYILPHMAGIEWDMRKGWRALNLDTVLEVSCKGTKYDILPDPISSWEDTTNTHEKVKNSTVKSA
ncbi:MAG: hypothetical protein CL532_01560 [Aestuariivita sp.]|nr:hypothetical protein [Aestuariivita sp.]|tara:strand:+ start:3614 stop:3985 length:372 start_codon:yes stop_codon:yes gene_type:complete